jgi:hypothetical protein
MPRGPLVDVVVEEVLRRRVEEVDRDRPGEAGRLAVPIESTTSNVRAVPGSPDWKVIAPVPCPPVTVPPVSVHTSEWPT